MKTIIQNIQRYSSGKMEQLLPQLKDIITFKRVSVMEFDNESGIEIIEEPFVGTMEDGYFVAKVHAAPLNPLDLTKLAGNMPIQLPFTPGSECSGVIIHPDHMRGKKVSFLQSQGAFRTYAIGNMRDSIILPDNFDLNRGACAMLNPLTCQGLYWTSKDLGAKAIVNTAANSQLGIMNYKNFTKKGMEVINLVRGEARVREFSQKYNAKYVLDILGNNFDNELKALSEQLGVTVCLDTYGGEISGRILNALPENSHQISCGSLVSPFITNINNISMRWLNKSYQGYTVYRWFGNQTKERIENVKQEILDGLDDEFSTVILKEYPLKDFKEGLKCYKKNMSGGKILITM